MCNCFYENTYYFLLDFLKSASTLNKFPKVASIHEWV
jgi:hypothetical protein